jgi:uncharacterized membrane protein YozB (DUF420 family)
MDAPLDPKVLYWTGAFVNLVVIAALAVRGVRLARAGDYARHARSMRAAAILVGAFLLSYTLKLAVLGREEPGTWGVSAVWILRVHELCVLVMLLGGIGALVLSRRLRGTVLFTRAAGDPAAPPALAKRHRVFGRSAVIGALLGAASAALVLTGMYARARWIDVPALAQSERVGLE